MPSPAAQNTLKCTIVAQVEAHLKEARRCAARHNQGARLEALQKALEEYDTLSRSSTEDLPIKRPNILVEIAEAYELLSVRRGQIKYLAQALVELRERTLEDCKASSINRVSVCRKLGNAYGKIGDYKKKLTVLKAALEMYPSIYTDETIELAHIKYSLGSAQGKLGDINSQIELQQDAIRIYESIDPDRNELYIANTLNSLGSAYASTGQYELAISAHSKALEIARKILGNYHLNVAKTLNSLGNTRGAMRDYAEQIKLKLEALEILERVAPNNYMIGVILNDLGIAYGEIEDYETQSLYFERALQFSMESLIVDRGNREILEYNLAVVEGNVAEFKIFTLFSEWLSSLSLESYVEQAKAQAEYLLDQVAGTVNAILSVLSDTPIKEGQERVSIWILDNLLEFQETLQNGVLPMMPQVIDPNPGPDYDGGACSSEGPPCAPPPAEGALSLGGSSNSTDSNFKEYHLYVS